MFAKTHRWSTGACAAQSGAVAGPVCDPSLLLEDPICGFDNTYIYIYIHVCMHVYIYIYIVIVVIITTAVIVLLVTNSDY